MALDRDKVIDILLEEINRAINDSYVRGEMYKDVQEVNIQKVKILNAYRDAYEKLFIERNREESLPAPADIEAEGIFQDAAREAFDYVNKIIDSGRGANRRKPGSPKNSKYALFMQTHKTVDGKRRIFTQIKSIGIKHLNRYLVSIGQKELSTVGTLIDSGLTKNEALAQSEDIYYRRFIHREHLGRTTTGTGTIAARLQAYDKLVGGAGEAIFTSRPSKNITDIFEKVETTYEVHLDNKDLIKVQAKTPIKLSMGSFKLNLTGARRDDLTRIGPIFDRHVKKVLAAMPLEALESFTSAKALRTHIANELTEFIGVRVGGATYTKAKVAEMKRAKREAAFKKGMATSITLDSDRPMKGTHLSKRELGSLAEESLRTALFLKLELMKRIKQVVTANMQSPALVNRTGRFASSVTITDVSVTRQGRIPSVAYTYQLYPYQVFEPGHPMFTPDRDPQKLIDKSIREIARDLFETRITRTNLLTRRI